MLVDVCAGLLLLVGADSASQIAPLCLSRIRNSSSSPFNGNVKGVFNIWSNIAKIAKTWQICAPRSADTQESQNDTEKEKPDDSNLTWSTNQVDVVVVPESRELLIRLNRHQENKPKETDDALVWLFTSGSLPSSVSQLQILLQNFCSTSAPTGLQNLQGSLTCQI